jgi:small-conductance mechanosensitive channel
MMDYLPEINWSNIVAILSKIWNYSIVTVDAQDILIGNVVIAILLLFAGVKISSKVRYRANKYLKNHHLIDNDTSNVIEILVYYFCLSISFILALEMANIPLTVFAFVGGALAIGIGFGAQNIINNFISGIIILIEKPFRVGDIIEFGNYVGEISHVGSRCVILKDVNLHEVIIPNSSLLQNNFINWTYTDTIQRASLSIEVPHKTNLQKVKTILEQISEDIEYILKNPAPEVLLTSFSGTGAAFELYFYHDLRQPIGSKELINQLNFKLAEKFAQENLEFALQTVNIKLYN